MKVYLANKKGFIRYILMGAILLAFVIFLLDKATFTEKPFIVLPLLIPILLILWIYLDTVYKIAENRLIYRSGLLKGEIEIQSIIEIQKGKTIWSGTKPALAKNGLIIKLNTYEKVYIAPIDNNEMIG